MAKKPTKADIQRDKWIAETQMFQRIARTPESTYADLAAEWATFGTKRKRAESDSAETHVIIAKQAGDKTE
jgi:hypothetical protein